MLTINRVPKFLPLLAAALLCGCQGTSQQPNASTAGANVSHLPVAGRMQTATEGPASIEDAVYTDPSAIRLGHIVDALFIFFVNNKAMPAQLADLKTADDNLQIVSPSGKPYDYYPQGLVLPNSHDTKLLVVSDPVLGANGRRWCVLASQLKPGAALTAEVMDIPEITYRAFLYSKP